MQRVRCWDVYGWREIAEIFAGPGQDLASPVRCENVPGFCRVLLTGQSVSSVDYTLVHESRCVTPVVDLAVSHGIALVSIEGDGQGWCGLATRYCLFVPSLLGKGEWIYLVGVLGCQWVSMRSGQESRQDLKFTTLPEELLLLSTLDLA